MEIRIFRSDDIDFAIEMTKAEGWLSETREVFRDFFIFQPDGCFIAEEEGERIGMIVATPYGLDGFIGELIVDPAWRGSGRGKALMEHAMAFHAACGVKNIHLDGVVAAVPLYERLGFRKVCRSLRFTGELTNTQTNMAEVMKESDLPEVLDLDRRAFGADRSFFLRQKRMRSKDTCYVHRSRGRITGYLFAAGGKVINIGPWVEEHPVDSQNLLLALGSANQGRQIRIGVLENNEAAVEMLRNLGFNIDIHSPWRMVIGQSGLGESSRCIAIGSPAAG